MAVLGAGMGEGGRGETLGGSVERGVWGVCGRWGVAELAVNRRTVFRQKRATHGKAYPYVTLAMSFSPNCRALSVRCIAELVATCFIVHCMQIRHELHAGAHKNVHWSSAPVWIHSASTWGSPMSDGHTGGSQQLHRCPKSGRPASGRGGSADEQAATAVEAPEWASSRPCVRHGARASRGHLHSIAPLATSVHARVRPLRTCFIARLTMKRVSRISRSICEDAGVDAGVDPGVDAAWMRCEGCECLAQKRGIVLGQPHQ